MTFQDKLVLSSFRGPCFDHVRLIAAVIVLLHHCRGLEVPDVRDDFLFRYSNGFMDFGRFAVIIFFSMSGFLVTPGLARTGNLVDYVVSRSMRIFPGLIVNVALTMFVLGPILTTHSLVSYFKNPQTYLYAKNALTLLVNSLPGVNSPHGDATSINGALWTLHFEVLCYLVLGLLSAFGLLRLRSFLLIAWFGVYAAYIAMQMDASFAAVLNGRPATFVSLLVYFGAGVLLFVFREQIRYSAVIALGALAVLLGALPLGGGSLAMPICLPYLIMFSGLSTVPKGLVLRHDLSYGVYLIHAPILLAFSLAFPNVRSWWIAAVVILVLTLALAYLSWIFVENPALKKKKDAAALVSRWINTIEHTTDCDESRSITGQPK